MRYSPVQDLLDMPVEGWAAFSIVVLGLFAVLVTFAWSRSRDLPRHEGDARHRQSMRSIGWARMLFFGGFGLVPMLFAFVYLGSPKNGLDWLVLVAVIAAGFFGGWSLRSANREPTAAARLRTPSRR
jgi:hypothetical protein